MDLSNSLEAFVLVADHRSFVAASRLTGVSASAVGKSVAKLEEHFGVRLFHRSTRSVTLTAEGERLLQRARRILAELRSAYDEFGQVSSLPSGRLRVSLPLLGDPLLPMLAEFKKSYPDVELDLDLSDRRVDLIEEGFDLGIRTGEEPDSRLTSRMLGRFRMMIVASPAYLLERGTPISPKDLLAHSCVLFRFQHNGRIQRWPLGQVGSEFVPALRGSVVSNSTEARLQFALRGVGLAYLPEFLVDAHLKSGALVHVLQRFTEVETFRLIWPAERQALPKLRALIDFLTGSNPWVTSIKPATPPKAKQAKSGYRAKRTKKA